MKKNTLLLKLLLSFSIFCAGQKGDSNSLLWRIDSKSGGEPSYLFGTIHLPQKKFVVYTDSVYAAIQHTQAFYNEIDFLNQSLFSDTSLMNFLVERGNYFKSLQETDAWKKLIDNINKRYDTKLAYDSLDQFIEFSQSFTAKVYQPEEDMELPDLMLGKHAQSMGKKLGGLETYYLQFKMLFDIVDARLKNIDMGFEDEAIVISTMKKFYEDEQLDSISSMIDKMHPTFKELVFGNRNTSMADSIEKHILNQASFFAIGAGHLPGSTGVISQLRNKGFTLKPVKSKNRISLLIVNEMMKFASEKNEGVKDIEVVEEPPPPPPPPLPPGIEMQKVEIKKVEKPAPKKKTKQ